MSTAPTWRFASFWLDPTTTCLWRDDQLVPLPPKACAVLTYLVAHAGEVVPKATLLEAVWPETVVSEGVLKTCMSHIRRALGETGRTPQYIATVHRRGYRFLAPVTAMVSPLATSAAAAPALPRTDRVVGREADLAQLHQWWTWAQQGRRQLVCITGEAGIGKTALVDAFVARVATGDAVWSSRGHCLEHYGAGEAYLPLLEALSHLGRGPDGAQLCAVLRQQAPSWLLQLPALVADAELAGLQRRAMGATRERMLRELAEAVETLTAERPLVLVLEDLHWSDVSTLDWLAYMARRREAARLLVLGTYRPAEAIAHGHPIHTVTQELLLHGHGHELILEYLSEGAVAAYLAQRFGAREWPEGLVGALYQRTHGNPLFLVAVVEDLLRRGAVQEAPHRVALPEGLEAVTVGIPESLRQLIERHFTQLPPAQQEVLEGASLAGTEFAAAAVAAGLAQEALTVEAHCATLARQHQFLEARGIAEWPDGTVSARYGFTHDLYCETLVARVPAGRRVQWHQRIGARLEAGYGAQARELAAELALHFLHGRDLPRAVQYLRYAGENALQRSAHQEAIGHLTTGLQLLTRLPETPERLQQELGIQATLGLALIATKGYAAPDVEHTYAQARTLCQRLGETPQLFPVLHGLWVFYLVRAATLQAGRELAGQLLDIATRQDDPALLLEAHMTLGVTLCHSGELVAALAHLDAGRTLYDPQQHQAHASLYGQDPGVACLSYGAIMLWYLGYPDQALRWAHEALRLAEQLTSPFSLAFARFFLSLVHQHRREVPATREHVETLLALTTAHHFPYWIAHGTVMSGWVRTMEGQREAGMADFHQGLVLCQIIGGNLARTHWLSLLAEVYGNAGQHAAGLTVVEEALTLGDKNGEQFYRAELYRLKGELLLGRSMAQTGEAEACLQQALAVARRQQAKAWELRAAMSLARLWQQQGKRVEARELLGPVYGWFTEGFDTADLQEAKALLEELA